MLHSTKIYYILINKYAIITVKIHYFNILHFSLDKTMHSIIYFYHYILRIRKLKIIQYPVFPLVESASLSDLDKNLLLI